MVYYMYITKIHEALNELDVWVCSFGGCGTNLLADYLVSKGLQLHTKEWRERLCHYHTYVPTNTPAIYMYGDPIAALKSQKHRGLAELNYKKLQIDRHEQDQEYTDEKMLRLMESQYNSWMACKHDFTNILFIKYETLYDNLDNIASFLDIDMTDFPVKHPRTSQAYTLDNETELISKFSMFIKSTE